jgi:hypothetical protein
MENRTEIREFYEKKKASSDLSLNLLFPTAAKLRNECFVRFKQGCSKSDEQMLKSFLERQSNDDLQDSTIRRCDPDKFKSLCNYLKKNIKLLKRTWNYSLGL